MTAGGTGINLWRQGLAYERLAESIQRRNATILARLRPPDDLARDALDVGCGTGFLAEAWLAGAAGRIGRLVCLDVSPDMLAVARSKPALTGTDFVCASLLDYAAPEPFGLIGSNAAFHWLYPGYREALERLHALLAVDGRLYLATAGRSAASDRFDQMVDEALASAPGPRVPVAFAARRLSAGAFAPLAVQAGFVLEECFVLERWITIAVADYVDWLLASGGPWAASAEELDGLGAEARARLTQRGDPMAVGHFSLFAVARKR